MDESIHDRIKRKLSVLGVDGKHTCDVATFVEQFALGVIERYDYIWSAVEDDVDRTDAANALEDQLDCEEDT